MALFKVLIPLRASDSGWQPAQPIATEDRDEDWPSLTCCLNDLASHGWTVVDIVSGSTRVAGEFMPCPVAFILRSENASVHSDLERRLKRVKLEYSRRFCEKPSVKAPGDEIHLRVWESEAKKLQETIQALDEKLKHETARGEAV